MNCGWVSQYQYLRTTPGGRDVADGAGEILRDKASFPIGAQSYRRAGGEGREAMPLMLATVGAEISL